MIRARLAHVFADQKARMGGDEDQTRQDRQQLPSIHFPRTHPASLTRSTAPRSPVRGAITQLSAPETESQTSPPENEVLRSVQSEQAIKRHMSGRGKIDLLQARLIGAQ